MIGSEVRNRPCFTGNGGVFREGQNGSFVVDRKEVGIDLLETVGSYPTQPEWLYWKYWKRWSKLLSW